MNIKFLNYLFASVFCIICCGVNERITGQISNGTKRSLFFELAGSGGLGSVNFEQRFWEQNVTELTWRAGFSLAPVDKNNGIGLVFPVMVNVLLGEKSHKLELGLGQGITISTHGSFFALTTAVIGYRYQSADKKWFYRVSYTPLISYLVDFQIQQWGGLSIGYSLNNKKNEK